jgi:hypothetical protein
MPPGPGRNRRAEGVHCGRLCDTAPNARVIHVTVAIRGFPEYDVNTLLDPEFRARP